MPFGPGLAAAPDDLARAPGVGAVWQPQGRGQGFWRRLLPARIWGHPSRPIDLQLFVPGRILTGLGVFGGAALTPAVAAWMAGLVPAPLRADSLGPVVLAFLLWRKDLQPRPPSMFEFFQTVATTDAAFCRPA